MQLLLHHNAGDAGRLAKLTNCLKGYQFYSLTPETPLSSSEARYLCGVEHVLSGVLGKRIPPSELFSAETPLRICATLSVNAAHYLSGVSGFGIVNAVGKHWFVSLEDMLPVYQHIR